MPSASPRRNRRISSASLLASFAVAVSQEVRRVLREAEAEGLAGDTAAALTRLRAAAAALPDGADGDRVAIGELALVVSAWADEVPACNGFLEELADQVRTPGARGALYFHRGRGSMTPDHAHFLTQALTEFTIAGDLRGRAVTLGQMCWPTEAPVGSEHRIRVGQEGLALAKELGDPWAIAFCAGRLAGCETYLDVPGALDHWREAAQVLPTSPDSVTAEIASLNQYNWGLTALGHGDYPLARQVLEEGRALAHGAGWRRRYDEAAAVVAWRRGDHERAAATAGAVYAGAGEGGHIAGLVLGALQLEAERQPDTALVDDAVRMIRYDEQMRWLALAVQARLRVHRAEPAPLRDLPAVIDAAERTRTRLGWEDVMLVMAEHEPDLARDALARLAPLWPSYPRGRAVRQMLDGLLAGPRGYDDLRAAAAQFLTFPEPVTAGHALHAAARVAPSVAEGNQLRREAIGHFQAAGADRSLATVLRDRALHRGSGHVPVPENLRQSASAGLTPREREVASLAAWGLTAQEIADELTISVATARHHLFRVRQKFGGIPKRKLALLLAARDARP